MEKNITKVHTNKESNTFSYRVVFDSKENLIKFKEKIKLNPDIIEIRADIQS